MGPPSTSLLPASPGVDLEVFRMSARLGECKHSRRPPSLSFGATTEYHRSSQPLYPLTRSHRRPLHEAGESMLAGPLHCRPVPEGPDSGSSRRNDPSSIAVRPTVRDVNSSPAEAGSPPTLWSASRRPSTTGAHSALRLLLANRGRHAQALGATALPPSTRPKSNLREQDRYIYCHRLSRLA